MRDETVVEAIGLAHPYVGCALVRTRFFVRIKRPYPSNIRFRLVSVFLDPRAAGGGFAFAHQHVEARA